MLRRAAIFDHGTPWRSFHCILVFSFLTDLFSVVLVIVSGFVLSPGKDVYLMCSKQRCRRFGFGYPGRGVLSLP